VSLVGLALLAAVGVYVVARGSVTKHWKTMVVEGRPGTPTFSGFLRTSWADGMLDVSLQIAGERAWFQGCAGFTVTFEDQEGLELATLDLPARRFARIQLGLNEGFEASDTMEMPRSTYDSVVRWGLRWVCRSYVEPDEEEESETKARRDSGSAGAA
jgi:hypothetical protein